MFAPQIEQGLHVSVTVLSVLRVHLTDRILLCQILGTNYFTASDFLALDRIRRTVVQGTCETVEGEWEKRVELRYLGLTIEFRLSGGDAGFLVHLLVSCFA